MDSAFMNTSLIKTERDKFSRLYERKKQLRDILVRSSRTKTSKYQQKHDFRVEIGENCKLHLEHPVDNPSSTTKNAIKNRLLYS